MHLEVNATILEFYGRWCVGEKMEMLESTRCQSLNPLGREKEVPDLGLAF